MVGQRLYFVALLVGVAYDTRLCNRPTMNRYSPRPISRTPAASARVAPAAAPGADAKGGKDAKEAKKGDAKK
jgi:hypothetical protein